MDLRRRELGSRLGTAIKPLIASLIMGAVLLSGLVLTTRAGARDLRSGRCWPQGRASSLPRYSLEPLIWKLDLGDWYRENTGHTPDADYFGTYAIQPVTNSLYVGFGTGLEFIAISFWPERNWIVVADRGAGARLWRIDLSGRRYHHSPGAAEEPFSPVRVRAIAAR